jgi:hypothetical protein
MVGSQVIVSWVPLVPLALLLVAIASPSPMVGSDPGSVGLWKLRRDWSACGVATGESVLEARTDSASNCGMHALIFRRPSLRLRGGCNPAPGAHVSNMPGNGAVDDGSQVPAQGISHHLPAPPVSAHSASPVLNAAGGGGLVGQETTAAPIVESISQELGLQLGDNSTTNHEAFHLLLNERDDGARTRILQQLDQALRTTGVVDRCRVCLC